MRKLGLKGKRLEGERGEGVPMSREIAGIKSKFSSCLHIPPFFDYTREKLDFQVFNEDLENPFGAQNPSFGFRTGCVMFHLWGFQKEKVK